MARPVDILGKMLELDARDYDFQDRAVAGGLSRYADTWRRQAREAFGDAAEAWIEKIGERLDAYSAMDPSSRRETMRELHALLDSGPGGAQTEEPAAEPAPEPAAASAEPAAEVAEEEVGRAEEVAEVAVSEVESTPETPRRRRQPSGRGLSAPVTIVSGIGEKRSEELERLGIKTIGDLIHHIPHRYEDYSQLKTISRLQYGERVSVLATVWEAGAQRTRSGTPLFKLILSDNTGTIEVTWFGQAYLQDKIRQGMQILVSGKVDEYLGRLTMNAPEWEIVGRTQVTNARIQPVYPLTEGLNQRWMRNVIRRTLSTWAKRVPDPLPEEVRREHDLIPVERALWGIHLPDSREHLEAARRRLAFEQTFYLQIGLLRQKMIWKSQPGRVIVPAEERMDDLLRSLPYTLTKAQERSLNEMLVDLKSGDPMNRLLQGDVGSGKTVVAALLMAVAADQGHQAAMMAPTEILAEQHYQSLASFFAELPEPRPTLGLLTGSTSGEAREQIYQGLADGTLQVVVGTHALIQESVEFDDLALVVIDEQHRFGVEQRGTLREKGYNPHLLVMTATPIPRSLELTIWGHVDVSVLDEMPPGRRPVRTRLLHPRERGRAYTFIESQVAEGRQAFIIYPLVESSDKIEARAAVDEHERLSREVFPNLRLGLLHGRMRSDEKDEIMTKFAEGRLDVLVATSVVEVGIDVPNATVMLIDGAERFGLAQLHQFRGRVGRGAHQSHCLLLAEEATEEATQRLSAVEATTDGFILAEKDLQMRGPGEFLGTRQSGIPEMPMAEYADTRLLHEVREAAARLLERDRNLEAPDHELLAERVSEFWLSASDLS